MRQLLTSLAEVVGFVLVVSSLAAWSLVVAGVVAGVGLSAGGYLIGRDG